MSPCCCILRAQDETVDTEELSRLLADHSPTDTAPLFVGQSETGFGINWQKQFFVIKRMAYPVPQHQIELLGSEQLVADLSDHCAHLLVFHIQGQRTSNRSSQDLHKPTVCIIYVWNRCHVARPRAILFQ
jgi:hypothetical protein